MVDRPLGLKRREEGRGDTLKLFILAHNIEIQIRLDFRQIVRFGLFKFLKDAF